MLQTDLMISNQICLLFWYDVIWVIGSGETPATGPADPEQHQMSQWPLLLLLLNPLRHSTNSRDCDE